MKILDHKRVVEEIFYAGLKAVDPYESVRLYTNEIRSNLQAGNYKRLHVIGFGKASCPMARAIENWLFDLIGTGVVITKYGHIMSQKSETISQKSKIRVYDAGHPLPDGNGVAATEKITNVLGDADEHTLVVCLISGGGSALLVSPYEGIALHEKQIVTDLLLKAGANIHELNTVRKHMSKVKGGRLAEIAYPAKVISLILSDVIGDSLDVIASGPTSPDSTTYHDALKVIEQYELMDRSPLSVLEVLKKGAEGIIPETSKEGSPIFDRVENIIIGNNKKAMEAARAEAESFGLDAEIISSELTGEARDIGEWLAKVAIEMRNTIGINHNKKICLISGGETTVRVRGNGIGGRNMELALAFAREIEGVSGVTLLSAGTDGTDGPTDAAGAIVDGNTVLKARTVGIDPLEYLGNNDSYNFFKKIDELFITGPTGTNVMDIQFMLIE